MELLRCEGTLASSDAKTCRRYRFTVPPETGEIQIYFAYDPGGHDSHSLVTLALFDRHGFRGAGHRFQPQQVIRIAPGAATPGFLPGPLPSGDWIVEIDIFWVSACGGGESNHYRLAVEARPEQASPGAGRSPGPQARRPVGSAPGWYRGELHLHTDHSDASWTAAELAANLQRRGADFAALTDHNTISGLPEMLALEVADLLVIPGIELTTFSGHALALGSGRWYDWRTAPERTINDIAQEVRAAGDLLVVAHPQAPPDEVCTGCRWAYRDFDPALADAVEVWSGRWDNPEGTNPGCLIRWHTWLNAGHRLAAIGATDAHGINDWEGATPMTYVYAEGLTVPAILQAIRLGHTYVSSGPVLQLWGLGEGRRRAMMGEVMPARPLPRLLLTWARCPRALLRLVANGEVRHVKHVQGEGEVALGAYPGDKWYSAELWDERGDALLAVTSPIYLE